MNTYTVIGGNKLEGELTIQGSKNSALPIIASTILSGSTSIIKNCPNIRDTLIMQDILKVLGCKVSYNNNILFLDSSLVNEDTIPESLMKEMRSSIILMGAILARCKRVVLSYPGGYDT